jgi:tight adherence protein B
MRIKVLVVLITANLLFGIGYLFYKNMIVALVCSGFSYYAIPAYRTYMKERRDRMMSEQFRYVLYSLSSLLAAGRSVENAFRLVENDLLTLYSANSLIVIPELVRLNGKVSNGETIEKALFEFGQRTNQADIKNFAEVFSICKRSGGDLIEVVRKTVNMIAEKMEIEHEIKIITAQKKFEAKAMAVVPVAIVALLAFSSPEYMEPLYAGVGRLIMTFAMVVFLLCYFWITKITSIRL